MDGPPIPRRTTERLVLREWRDEDRAPFAAMNADPLVMAHFEGTLPPEASDAWLAQMDARFDALVDRIVERWASDGHGLWAVEPREDGRFIGFIGLAAPNFTAAFTPCVEVGWRLAPEAWGRGFATEGAREALRFGFEELGLEEIVSFTVPANVRSRAVMERIGLTRNPADDFAHPSFPEGHPLHDHVLCRIRRSDWQEASPSDRMSR